jgi:type I restriction enzyme S subunit
MSEKNNKYTPNLRFPEFTGEWKEKTLGEVGYFVRGLSYNKSDVTEDASSTLVIRSNNIIQDSAVDCINGLQYVTKTPSEEQQLEKGDIVICLANGSSNLVGKTSSFDGNHTGVVTVGAFCGIFRSSLPICKYLVQTSAYKNKINLIKQGGNGALANLYGKDILGLSFFIPTAPEEQQKIASCLSAMDDLIAAQAEKVEVLKEKKTGLMQQLFPQSGETTPRLRFPEFTGEWEVKKLGEVASSFSGGTPKSSESKYYGGDIPFIRSGEIHGCKTELYITEEGLNKSSAKLVSKGDLLIALYGATSGEVAISKIDGAINQAILCVRSQSINSNYLCNYLEYKKDTITSKFLQGGQGNLSSDIIMSLNIPSPSPTEQEKIASCLSALDDQIAAETEKHTALKDYKKGLMQQLFPQPAK